MLSVEMEGPISPKKRRKPRSNSFLIASQRMALQNELENLSVSVPETASIEAIETHADHIRSIVLDELELVLDRAFVESVLENVFTHMKNKWVFNELNDKKTILNYLFEFTDGKQRKALYKYLEKSYPDMVKKRRTSPSHRQSSPTNLSESPPSIEVSMIKIGDMKSSSCPSSPRNRRKLLNLKFRLSASLLPKFTWEINAEDVEEQFKIGEGSFGEIFYGKYNSKPVAIKRLTHIEASEKSLMNEISVLCRLEHPNIVKFIGAVLGAEISLVTRYEKNRDLQSYLDKKKGKKSSLTRRLKMAHDIINGVAYLHSKNIIHGDIKSSNVLVSRNLHCKLSDFGISHEGWEKNPDLQLGTLEYLAPELLRGDIRLPTKQSDMYSLGMTLYEIFECKTPFKGLSHFEIIRAIDENERPEISDKCPQDISTLIQRCWREDVDERPTPEEMIKVVMSLLGEDGSD